MSRGSQAVIEYRQRVKIALCTAFGNHCWLCGKEYPVYVYDFHHRDPSKKDFGISAKGLNHRKEETYKEACKCVLLCSNCHRIVHKEQIQEFPFEVTPDKEVYLKTFEELIADRKQLRAEQQGEDFASGKGHPILPDRDKLKELIREKTFREICLQFNVTDRAVRKRCVDYGLPHTKKDINRYSDKEWEKL